MTIQASALFGWPFAGIGNRLRTSPSDVQKLTAFRQAIDRILQSNLRVLTITPAMLATAAALSQQIGLLTNDGVILAVIDQDRQQRHRLRPRARNHPLRTWLTRSILAMCG